MNVSEKPGGLNRFKVDSKFFPMDETFRFGEEYTLDLPEMGLYRCIDTLLGDTIHTVSKGPKFTTTSTTKFTDNFVIMVISEYLLN